MGFTSICEDTHWWMLTLPAVLETQYLSDIMVLFSIFAAFLVGGFLTRAFSDAGPAWKNGRNRMGRVKIPGPTGLPIFGSLFSLSHGLAHRTLAAMASRRAGAATQLMAFSLGSTAAESAKQLMFSRAIGFAPNGQYWRLLRRIASTHLFAPQRILAHGSSRRLECAAMLKSITEEQNLHGYVTLRKHLQAASLNNIMGIVFGKKYEMNNNEEASSRELQEIVREGFELLGGFNWSDHLPWLKHLYDPFRVQQRCLALIPRVQRLFKAIIQEHKNKKHVENNVSDQSFVDVLLSLDGEEKLDEDDMVAVLWEMIFRGTDTTALLTEWIMAELVLNRGVQDKLRNELDNIVGQNKTIIRRCHFQLSNGMVIPANTTAMVNMWAISHDPTLWDQPLVFYPERFEPAAGGMYMDVRGNDLRLAPFGAGRRVCPGKNLGLATVSLWVANFVQHFEWIEIESQPVDLSEVLKLSCEMKHPLLAKVVPRKY
nr:cytochrome P450 family 78 subfamily A polypeptide 1 [Ipomoea batatas]